MNNHQFLFQPGYWVGEGKITFNASKELIKFYTRWVISEEKKKISCKQEVEIHGNEEHVINTFYPSEVSDDSFIIRLENELVGSIAGKGVVNPKKIAWEFRDNPNFDGFEVYELQENGDYLFHAEYVLPDLFRSIIDGRIWQKQAPSDTF